MSKQRIPTSFFNVGILVLNIVFLNFDAKIVIFFENSNFLGYKIRLSTYY